MFSLGTGIMRLVNIGLMIAIAVALAVGVYKMWSGHYIDVGRGQVTNQIQDQNNKLDNEVQNVNANVIHDVTHETDVIVRNSHDVEYVVRNSPVEPISDVTRNRLDVVHNQQQSIREASQSPK